jgi:hypothetical protein
MYYAASRPLTLSLPPESRHGGALYGYTPLAQMGTPLAHRGSQRGINSARGLVLHPRQNVGVKVHRGPANKPRLGRGFKSPMRNLEKSISLDVHDLTSIAQSKELLSRNGSDATRVPWSSQARRQLFANAAIAPSRVSA